MCKRTIYVCCRSTDHSNIIFLLEYSSVYSRSWIQRVFYNRCSRVLEKFVRISGVQWCFLLLNSDKTEILLVGPKNSTQNLLDYNLQLDGCTVTSSTVKNLGVILDSNLSFENHISNVTKTAFFHLRNISKLRNMLSVSDAEKLVHAFMTSRLDYCNALLGGCPASSINKLQIVQNAGARVLTRSIKYDHITPILQLLHWPGYLLSSVSVTKYYYLPIRP